jgi:hypothetical protein
MPDLWHGLFWLNTKPFSENFNERLYMFININGQDVNVSELKIVDNRLVIRTINPPKPDKLVEHQTVNTSALTETVRSGNGHKIAKVRSLSDHEKNRIRVFFQAVNGEIRPDSCTRLWQSMVQEPDSKDISVFQVTGFVTYLHGQVMGGVDTVRNLPRYLAYLQTHREMWLKYNSPKYAAMRLNNHVNHQLVKILEFVPEIA